MNVLFDNSATGNVHGYASRIEEGSGATSMRSEGNQGASNVVMRELLSNAQRAFHDVTFSNKNSVLAYCAMIDSIVNNISHVA